jgi:hypothetical protein
MSTQPGLNRQSTDVSSWERDGILYIPRSTDAASVALLEQMQRRLSSWIAERDSTNIDTGDSGNSRDLSIVNALSQFPEFSPVLDCPAWFALVLGAMGPYIQVTGVELIVRYSNHERGLKLHRDGGPSLRTIPFDPARNCLTLKVQMFLSDLERKDSGNFEFVPSSHLEDMPADPTYLDAIPRQQILARAGDAIMFPWSLWHGVAPNIHGRIRMSIIVRYSQMFMRPVDDFDRIQFKGLTRRQQLLIGRLNPDGHVSDYDFYRCKSPGFLDSMYEGYDYVSTARQYRNEQKFGEAYYA